MLQDFMRELARPVYYRESIDCVFFAQKTDRMRKLIESDFDVTHFKSFVEFLADKRRTYSDVAAYQKSRTITSIAATVSNAMLSQEIAEGQITSKHKFFNDCRLNVALEPQEFTENNSEQQQHLVNPTTTSNPLQSNNKKAKILITKDKNKVQFIHELI